ncbi:ureidoglycolate lyase [Arenibaculum pallidiluteum]|uniref:ureidoglycolate lyase n=1 Tax=Arenibaculum pallidiluteum TaxID=2812559 RepID=UPI001A960385|nr:ureidoglycolate lyase [Arenibaculum pallidiluteum]
MRELAAVPISAAAFAPFGHVVGSAGATGRSVNEGRGLRYDAPAGLILDGPGTMPVVAVYAMAASRVPVLVRSFERHPLSSQLFVPTTAGRCLVVVTESDVAGGPDPARARAFVATRGQAFNYAPGVWHAPIFAIGAPGELVMVMGQAVEPDRDCEVLSLDEPILVHDATL